MSLLSKGLFKRKTIKDSPLSQTNLKTPLPVDPTKFKEGYLLVEINGGFRKKYIKTAPDGITIFENEVGFSLELTF